ncbi:MAG: CDGSH iron-sulfur domain-containing protein [Spirochaetia bacterium]|nr:CDGSH iron-sulfur domain-containing protein [Spirochaetia bacterium]
MEEVKIAEKKPAIVELEAGTYHWCKCGHSKGQPFCDGSYKTTSFTPLKFELVEKKKVVLCQCKHTRNSPYCDGTHKTL